MILNNGLFPNEWLIGDTKTGEIASLELALHNTPVRRTFNGFYWSANLPKNKKVQHELYGLKSCIPYFSKILSWGIHYRDIAFEELGEKYYGDIDVEKLCILEDVLDLIMAYIGENLKV